MYNLIFVQKEKFEYFSMPKRKGRRGSEGKREAKALARRERKRGLYLSPGDPDFKSLSEQLREQGLALRDVPGDGWVASSIW